jgi:hypothetical protein
MTPLLKMVKEEHHSFAHRQRCSLTIGHEMRLETVGLLSLTDRFTRVI